MQTDITTFPEREEVRNAVLSKLDKFKETVLRLLIQECSRIRSNLPNSFCLLSLVVGLPWSLKPPGSSSTFRNMNLFRRPGDAGRYFEFCRFVALDGANHHSDKKSKQNQDLQADGAVRGKMHATCHENY